MRGVALVLLVGCGRIGFDARTDGGSDGRDVVLPTNANIAFVTSTTHAPGLFGGTAGADAICAARAAEGGLAGTFVALLSLSTLDARDRISGARGWYRPDGLPLGDQAYELTGGSILHPIRLDEQGRDLIDDLTAYVATGTFYGIANTNCSNLTDVNDLMMAGYPSFTGGGWMNINNVACSTPMRLFCFQTDFNQLLARTQAQGRLAFVSTAQFDPSTGIAAADSLCGEDATAAGLSGAFRALLPTATPGPSRFDVDGAPWVRVDGVALAPTARAFLEGKNTASLNVTALGMYVDGPVLTGVFTGNAFEPVESTLTCGTPAWSQAGMTSEKGWVGATGVATYVFSTDDCVTLSRVYCLQQ